MNVSRREFLEAGAAAGAGLVLSVSMTGCTPDAPPPDGGAAFAPDAWIRIGTDDTVTVVVDRSEMGQGVSTALPMLVAEELDADWSTVRYRFAPANEAYYRGMLQVTGGSTAIREGFRPLRETAAKARLMLMAAAAARWGIAAERCTTENGAVVAPDGRRLRYGEVAVAAAALPVPARATLKNPREFRLIGKPLQRLDLAEKVDGRAGFGIDAMPEGVLIAVVARSPVFGGKLRRVDAAAARAVAGVRDVLTIPSGVAVVADGYWAAKTGRDALELEWDEGPLAGLDDAAVSARLEELAREEGHVARTIGQGAAALSGAAKTLDAVFEVPYLAHATMEPMNCTADVRPHGAGVTLWVPTQFQAGSMFLGGGSRGVAAKIAGVPVSRVTVHTTHLGGGFGRRAETDFVAEACQVSKAVGRPVKVIWSREDDIRHDQYRPAARHVLKGGLAADGAPLAWSHRIVCPSIIAKFLPSWMPRFARNLAGPLKGGVDANAIEGAAEIPYAFPHLEVSYSQADLGVPVGFWRSVGNSHTAFAVECFLDELAALAGRDPVGFRRTLLAGSPRHLAVLNLAADRAGWGTPLPAGRFRGVAVHASFGSWVAQVAEVSIEGGKVRVHRVVCAVDCGQVVNPDTVAAQMEGGIVFGLTAALKGKISLEKGRVKQSNFHDYPLLTMREMPRIEVFIVSSSLEPGGVGEPGTPPIAPAVANAVFAATGKPVRKLPIEV